MQFGGEGFPIPFQAMAIIVERMLEKGLLLEAAACLI